MSNEYVRYAEVTVTGKIGVRTRTWSDGSGTVQVEPVRIESNDPIVKSKSFQLEPGKFLPTSAIMLFIKDCDFDYILDVSMSYHTYKLMEVDENEPHYILSVNVAPMDSDDRHLSAVRRVDHHAES